MHKGRKWHETAKIMGPFGELFLTTSHPLVLVCVLCPPPPFENPGLFSLCFAPVLKISSYAYAIKVILAVGFTGIVIMFTFSFACNFMMELFLPILCTY